MTYMGFVPILGMLLEANQESLRPKMMENRAFMSGSSKQGKATRASAGSISDVAKYLQDTENYKMKIRPS